MVGEGAEIIGPNVPMVVSASIGIALAYMSPGPQAAGPRAIGAGRISQASRA